MFADALTVSGLQAFHRDADDWRFIKVVVYLTDVDEECGPHVCVRGTHLETCGMRLKDYSDEDILKTYGRERIVRVTGPAGTAFTVNTHGIHKGMLPSGRPRLLLQVQHSLLPVYRYRPVESERGEVGGVYQSPVHEGAVGVGDFRSHRWPHCDVPALRISSIIAGLIPIPTHHAPSNRVFFRLAALRSS